MGKVLFYCIFLLTAVTLLHAVNIHRCREHITVVKGIIPHANKTHPQTFHVPVDVKKECLDSALTCFRYQVPKLQASGINQADFERRLRKVKLGRIHDHEGCIPCANYTTHTPSEFLDKMHSFLQMVINN